MLSSHDPTMHGVPTAEENTALDPALDDNARYRALAARDARFDGRFFTGVTSTGIYCRPVCAVRTPGRANCRFFDLAAQAEHAGFRPCLRCRPELAPQAMHWSTQDASALLAEHAARWLDEPEAWQPADGMAGAHGPAATLSATAPITARLAARLGVSDRHLRRVFEAHLGVSPLQYLQTRRLLAAKQLLVDTELPITQVALSSGFSSLRRFNGAFVGRYGLNPSAMRRANAKPRSIATGDNDSSTRPIFLGYRPPYDVPAMLAFLRREHMIAIEEVAACPIEYWVASTFHAASPGGAQAAGACGEATGWLRATFEPERHRVALQVSDALQPVLPLVIRRVRAWLDLDADPAAIEAVLGPHFPAGAGLRVPGALDGFGLAVRAVLGQQVTVAAARTLARRLVEAFGEPVATPFDGLRRRFPRPEVLAQAHTDALGALGIVRQRQAAIVGLAQAVADGRLLLHAGADVPHTLAVLTSLPGIGDWTAHYIAMRALRWPDAFPAGDVALHKALGLLTEKRPARAAEAASQSWRPWRSYAVLRAWATLPPGRSPMPIATPTTPTPTTATPTTPLVTKVPMALPAQLPADDR